MLEVWLMKVPVFMDILSEHCKRQWMAYLLALALCGLFMKHYTIGINVTTSLPYTVFLVERNAPVHKGDIAAFRWQGGGSYAPGLTFAKIVAGVPGDQVEERHRDFYINGQFVGHAKDLSKKGDSLELGPIGIIPPDHFYMMAPHVDSLDSRYALSGWIDRDALIGKVVWRF